MRKYLLGLLLVLASSSVEAATYWVHPSGNNSNPCTSSTTQLTTTAKRTIQGGKGCPTQPGDILNIAAGTYNEKVDWSSGTSSGTALNPIIIQGFGGTVTWRGTGGTCAGPTCEATLYLSNRSGLTFKSITINHGNLNQYAAIDINVGLSGGPVNDVTFDNVEVTGGAQGFLIRNFGCPEQPDPEITCDATLGHGDAAGESTTPKRLVIKNSRIHTNGGVPRFDHGIYVGKCKECVFENNDIYNNAAAGITLGDENLPFGDVSDIEIRYNRAYNNGRVISGFPDWGGFGIHVSGASNLRIHHNQSYRNNGPGIFWDSGGMAQIYNNTLAFNVSTPNADGWGIQFGLNNAGMTSVSQALNNILWQNQAGAVQILTGNPTVRNDHRTDPLFTNAAANDFTLQPGSTAIDKAITSICPACSPPISITQFNGTAPDHGYWESGSTAPPGGPPSLVANPLALAGGTTVTAIVTENIAVPRTESVTDFVGIYAIGASGADFLDWAYANCTQTAPGAGVGNWNCGFAAPKVSGSYELRFYQNNSILDADKLATAHFTVVPGRVIRVGSGSLQAGSGAFQSGE